MELSIDITPAAVKHAGRMPARATRMVALPFPSAILLRGDFHEQPFASDLGSASMLLALAGMLPASGKGLHQLVITR